ncbi:MAG: hypothetical protein TREMPRED_003569, partial [Tremellales sp. Tagirdzhanova-0007]
MSTRVASGKMAEGNTIQPSILYKLILFAILMAVAPIGTYFGSLRYVWNGSSTPSAISAVIAANIVLVGYVVVAFREDSAAPLSPSEQGRLSEKRKDR